MLGQLLVAVVVIWLLMERWKKRGMYKLWDQLKNDVKSFPIIGHAYLFLGNDEDRMKVFQKYGVEAYKTGGLFAMWQANKLYINVSDPEIAEVVLKFCLDKDDIMKISRRLTGNGIIFAPVPIWRPRRKFLAPTFSPKNLMNFAQIFSRKSEVMVQQLRPNAGQGVFSIWKYIASYSMDSVCESTLGVQVNAQIERNQPFIYAFEELCKLDSARFCQPWFHNDTVYKMTPYYWKHLEYKTFLCEFIDKIIKKKRQSMKEEKCRPKPETEQSPSNKIRTFLELLIESSGGDQGYGDVELLEETLVLVLAGTDTSAVGTAFTSVMLSKNQDVQDKVFQEIQEVFGNTNRPLLAEDLPRLRYLDAVVRETLRLYPPVPLIVRKASKDFQLPSGLVLAKDCGVLVNIWAIQRNPKYWGKDSMEYRPERWLEGPLKHPAAFMPFSQGPRSCLGYQYAMMSMKTAVASIIRHYRILPSKTTLQNSTLRVKFDVMLKHVDNFELMLEERA